MLHMYEKFGSAELAADELNMSVSKFKNKLIKDLEAEGKPAGHLRTQHQVTMINKYLDRDFIALQKRIASPYTKDIAVCHLHNSLVVRKVSEVEGQLVGVYNKSGDTSSLRDDLYWYITNHMETSNV